ncbi:hypothetical protein KC902_01035 [Candidatus Kaiserbacteria bacterium]|nr:hypothetical protein [Candidatus Kaiserbacteria bacterium]USN88514.1 MAG: hypothetical protein H6780_03405 [Candidatus Nomurabacteria bacterium]
MTNYVELLKKQVVSKSASVMVAILALTPLVSSAQIKFNLKSPLDPSIVTVEGLLVAILNVFIVIATPIIVLFIIYAGFMYVTARGNAQQVEQATRALTYAVIGGVILLGAVAIAGIVKGVVDAFAA